MLSVISQRLKNSFTFFFLGVVSLLMSPLALFFSVKTLEKATNGIVVFTGPQE